MRSAGVRLLVLGPVEIAVDGRIVHLTSRQRALLAALVLDAGRVVSVERLANRLWDDHPPPSAAARLRALVAELRRALGPRGPEVIVTRSPGYLAEAGALAVDADEFVALAEEAHRATEHGRHVDAVAGYDAALRLWRGEPFADLPGTAAQAERHRLEERRWEVVERRAAASLELGRGEEAVAELTRLVVEQPLRERPHALLMRALCRSGRLPDALEVYRNFRARLVRELGIEPGKELQRLHQDLLDGEPATATAAPAPVPRQLPAVTSRFVGRTVELRHMDTGRVTLVAGPAGVGKTTLALHWAHRSAGDFPDGQLFLNMRGFDQREPMSPSEALQLLLQGLGVAARDIPVEPDAQAARYRSLMAGRRSLLILDDVAGPDQVRPLLPGTPDCRVVITSRARLGSLVALDGVERLTLDVLAHDDALRLVAQGIGEDRLRREPEAAAELLRLCGRLPLALSIAISWIGDHEHRMISHYVRRLADRGRLVRLRAEGDESTAVQAALDLSHRALPPAAQRMFRLISLAQGVEISAAAAAALARTGAEQAEDLLGAAARIHLLEEIGSRRYAVHDLVLEYAAQRSLAEDTPAERSAAVHRMLEYYLRTVAEAVAASGFPAPERPGHPSPPGVTATAFDSVAEATEWFDTEWDNLVAAVSYAAAHGPAPYAWLLVEAMTDLMHHRRAHGEWLRLAGIGLDAAERAGDLRGQAAMRHSMGLVRWRMTDPTGALRDHERALSLARRVGWAQGEAKALQGCGVALKQLGRPDLAIPRYRQALGIHSRLGFRGGESRALNNLASAYLMLGRLDRAERCLLDNLPLTAECGDPHLRVLTLVNLALVRQQQARFGEALASLDEAREVAGAAGLRYAEGVTHETYGWVHRDAGRHEQAVDAFSRALNLARDVENRPCQIASLTGMAQSKLALGRTEEALAHLDAALALAERTGTDLDNVLLGFAETHCSMGRYADALEAAQRALKLAVVSDPLNVARLHRVLGDIHLAAGDTDQAVQACERALRHAGRSGQRLEYARALMTLGHARAPADDRRARHHWARAHELFSAIGAPERLASEALLRT
ncbi:BTAD domain-containing putative transcriptional regulator [Nonomuraea sp. NPDC047897]|uniref:AfsR/SARP family transcriptional regulator n=1 Tax=Nonomuraea sp. NPDC047897 TaxID=3364346 RepID=UPI0037171D76